MGLTSGAILAGCAGTTPTIATVGEQSADVLANATDLSASPSVACGISASTIFRPGPWNTDRRVQIGTGKSARVVIERREASDVNSDGSWIVKTTQRETAADSAWQDVQSVTIVRNDRGDISLSKLVNFARESVVTFDPPLLMMPGVLAEGLTDLGKTSARSTALDGTSDSRKGTARVAANLVTSESGRAFVAITLVIELGPATITRTSMYDIAPGGDHANRETNELIVKGGPFVVQRERRTWSEADEIVQ
jgi:hypothetical protein